MSNLDPETFATCEHCGEAIVIANWCGCADGKPQRIADARAWLARHGWCDEERPYPNERRIITTLSAKLNEVRLERERVPDRLVRLVSTDELNAIKYAELHGYVLALNFAMGVVAADEPEGGDGDG